MAVKAKPKSQKKVISKPKAVSKKPVKAKKVLSKKVKPKPKPQKAKVVTKSKPKSKGATPKASLRSNAKPTKAPKGKAKTLTTVTKKPKPTVSTKKSNPAKKAAVSSTRTTAKSTTKSQKTSATGITKKVKGAKVAQGAKALGQGKKGVSIAKNVASSPKKAVAKKATKQDSGKTIGLVPSVVPTPQGKKSSSSKGGVDRSEGVLPNDIDAELDVEVEAGGGMTLETLTSELTNHSDDIDVADLDDDFADDDFSEDLADEADEADEDLDLTEDLAEELGPGKFIREPEGNNRDDEDEGPRSW